MNDITPLCCCEYFNNNNERRHLLTSCCECEDLDEGFESLITGQGFPQQNRTGLMTTIQDRLRIPWRGGAKQISFDAVLPILILPIMFLVSAISLWWTVFSFTAVAVILASIFRFFLKTIPGTKFFIVWTITSFVLLYIIFEFIVIPLLQILVEENIMLSILIGASLLSFYKMKIKTSNISSIKENEAENGTVGNIQIFNRCSICQIIVPEKDHHCVWLDCCIGRHNQFLFILGLLFAIAALLYSSNLILTSVCHPFVFYKTILLPDDCWEVYEQIDLGLSFVSAIYSLISATILMIIFFHQLLLVSLGLTSREWRNLSLISKCFLGLFSKRPHSLGFFGNWYRVICWNKS